MALISCSECNRKISEKATACPHCGYPLSFSIDEYKNLGLKDAVAIRDDALYSKKEETAKPKKKTYQLSMVLILIVIAISVILLYQYFKNPVNATTKQILQENLDSEPIEEKYLAGHKYLESQNYKKSIEIFEEISEYKNSSELLIEAKYLDALKHLRYKDYEYAKVFFENHLNYLDSKERLIECNYGIAIEKYESGDLESSLIAFENLGDYKESKAYLGNSKILKKFQGTWKSQTQSEKRVIIKGVEIVFYDSATHSINLDIYGSLNGGVLNYSVLDKKLYLEDDVLIDSYVFSDNSNEHIDKYNFLSSDTAVDTTPIKQKVYPSIGMTSEEIINSTWGKPRDINRTTTVYGTTEQWCYSGNKYIYLDNGIVTAIQD